MVPKSGTEKLIARVVYSGPVRAPVAEGQPVGVVRVWRGANVAMEAPVYAMTASDGFRTCQPTETMSAFGGRPEVMGRSK
jgi:hypothetical protein